MTIQIPVECISHIQCGTRFFFLFTYKNFFMVLSCTKNSWQYWRPLLDSLCFYLNIKFSDTATWKSQKPLITKNACTMKNIWLACKTLQYSINFYSFSTAFLKFICISENGSLVSLFQECPTWLSWRNSRHVLDFYFCSKDNDVPFDCKTFNYLLPI